MMMATRRPNAPFPFKRPKTPDYPRMVLGKKSNLVIRYAWTFCVFVNTVISGVKLGMFNARRQARVAPCLHQPPAVAPTLFVVLPSPFMLPFMDL